MSSFPHYLQLDSMDCGPSCQDVVSNISLVPVQTTDVIYYNVEIQLPDQLVTTYKKELPYLTNMRGQADIVTEDISLLERFS